jgi:hypothetical protein
VAYESFRAPLPVVAPHVIGIAEAPPPETT